MLDNAMGSLKINYSFRVFCLAICFAANASCLFAQAESPVNLFDFHSGFWINLHHFLYRQAFLSQPQKGPHSLALTGADSDEMQHLSPAERESWNAAVAYYLESITKRDLLFDEGLITTKDKLEDAEVSPDLANVQIAAELKAVLLSAAPIYRRHWWPRHDTENREWIGYLKPLVTQYGSTLCTRLIRVYGQPWPQYPVRVDAVAYANWAGAYTTVHPTRPTISTTDSANQGTAALEIVFHEASHGMMEKVMNAIQTAEENLNTHRSNGPFHSGSIWHAVLFYTAGELVAEQIPRYVPYADKNGLWVRAWPAPDRSLIEKDWKPHLKGSVELQQALSQLLDDLASTSSHE
ncbi:MAG TPA: hypothetical protein VKP58_06580 [Candidatus Acidoferrum sp.]|nr:hypothetical protein [Candidatus Acidoferrum sp.]